MYVRTYPLLVSRARVVGRSLPFMRPAKTSMGAFAVRSSSAVEVLNEPRIEPFVAPTRMLSPATDCRRNQQSLYAERAIRRPGHTSTVTGEFVDCNCRFWKYTELASSGR